MQLRGNNILMIRKLFKWSGDTGVYGFLIPPLLEGASRPTSKLQQVQGDIFYCPRTQLKNSGLVMTQKNTLCYGVANLFRKYFMPLNLHNNPLIHTVCSMQGVRAQPVSHLRGGAPAYFWYLWQNWMDIIQDMHAVNTDSSYYLQRSPKKCLQVSERDKKEVSAGMPTAMLALLVYCFLCWRTIGDVIQGNAETDCELPYRKVKSTVLLNMHIR